MCCRPEPVGDIEKLKTHTRGTIRIKLTHPECTQININFEARPLFELQPSPRIILHNAEPGKAVTRQIWVLSNYDDQLDIESISSSKQITKILSRQPYGNRIKLELQITPPIRTGKRRFFSDKLTIKVKGGGELIVNCSGWYAKDPKKDK